MAVVVKNLPASAGDIQDAGSFPELGRSLEEGMATTLNHSCLEEGMATTLNHSCLENPMDRGAWRATVHRVAKSQT